MTGTVLSICTSPRKGHSKSPVQRARVIDRHGIEGDAHAGPWHRQLSLLAVGDIEFMRARGLPGLRFGSFAENLVVSGINFDRLGVGSRLRLGREVEIIVTQIGKECHTACAIMARVGECIMPTRGLFAEVVRGGEIAPGAAVEILEAVPRETRAMLPTTGAA
jgi:MOSC domain-containing protein YiiM